MTTMTLDDDLDDLDRYRRVDPPRAVILGAAIVVAAAGVTAGFAVLVVAAINRIITGGT